MTNPDLQNALEIIRRVHAQMPVNTHEQMRLRCNLACGIVLLEDGLRETNAELPQSWRARHATNREALQ
jgi:hypothetical protein